MRYTYVTVGQADRYGSIVYATDSQGGRQKAKKLGGKVGNPDPPTELNPTLH